jgi:hypothetical protein
MRYSLLMVCGVAALLLTPRSASALESCYQICTPSVPCSTPCIDPYRPYLGPLACGAGFQCNRHAPQPAHEGFSSNEDNVFSELNPDPAACDGGQGEDSLFLPSLSLQ